MAEIKGILGRKIGMTQVFDENGRAVPVTVVEAGPCRVSQVKLPETDGYLAVQLSFGTPRKVTKPLAGHFKKANVDPGRHLVELRLEELGDYALGFEVKADIFDEGELVDVVGVTKGKGFAGGMKRHNFKGLSASHGTQRKHRSPGSIGACATPARVFKGTRMAGQMGHVRVTTLNLKVIKADSERNVLLLRGAVPGPKGGLVMVRSAVRVLRRKAS
ncbi:MAG: large subunit ribosomal protein [Actinomycetota bacterium]|jgi:large subunit ribosomal protein L3|nr:large subunit ribosomal protein [Actinomycetota bacterium]MEA2486379.1 large subunit ribosomal protein [Actinomycetota bacterium]